MVLRRDQDESMVIPVRYPAARDAVVRDEVLVEVIIRDINDCCCRFRNRGLFSAEVRAGFYSVMNNDTISLFCETRRSSITSRVLSFSML